MDAIIEAWRTLALAAPVAPKGKPDHATHAALKAHKTNVKRFTAALTDDQATQLKGLNLGFQRKARKDPANRAPDLDAALAAPAAVGQSTVHKGLTLLPHRTPVRVIGAADDSANPAVDFHGVIPFYSHTIQSRKTKRADAALGINRRVFSNLFIDDGPFALRPGPAGSAIDERLWAVMKHPFLATAAGACSESFFQAAKMELEADARFIMFDLDGIGAAKYGQGRLFLTAVQREKLIGHGIAAGDIEGSEGSWKRTPTRRADWDQVKLSWMLYLLRCKFLPAATDADADADAPPSQAQKTASVLVGRAAAGEPWLPVEHTGNDGNWGDDSDGSGTNLLGRSIAQVILEAANLAPRAPLPLSAAMVAATVATPSAELIRYQRSGGDVAAAASDEKEIEALDLVVVLDFEATCWGETEQARSPQEIIEFPGLLVNAQTGELVSEFHEYVRPDVHPTLSDFCTELTGITQSMVDGGAPLKGVMARHMAWLASHGLELAAGDGGQRFAYVTCGDWDLSNCLPRQLRYHGSKPPAALRRWINIKHAYFAVTGNKARGMAGMLRALNMELEGRHHSGIDDCRNIHRIVQRLLKQGWKPTL